MKHLLILLSILIFQSQLYGINLTCYFKQKINDKLNNPVICSNYDSSVCEVERQNPNFGWYSELRIMDTNVVLFEEPSDSIRSTLTNKKLKEINGEVCLKFE